MTFWYRESLDHVYAEAFAREGTASIRLRGRVAIVVETLDLWARTNHLVLPKPDPGPRRRRHLTLLKGQMTIGEA